MISTARVVVFFSAVALGIVSLLTGLVLYFWPRGPRSGWLVIMGLNKSGWSDLHAYSSILALLVIAVHLILNWKSIKLYVKCLKEI
ncbi:MAG: DUF4405 domain-containing protein [Thaumarchaeota archaeon]|jgi:uncharacterized iron-regulated membrane protein|nr:DUF4405 domain-containing protein [Candidatus Terraquivivens yellowstonensis]MCL7398623.1 DUF4405 domain-containing protein [Candidatus Terraquivivens yellowstonensis]MCL7400145.1 DUF4405 domain-containing protein [Candidatus Terraquivivens yellowstonensis]